jgi:hypothetical protein
MTQPALRRPPRRGGWLLIEVVTAVALLSLIIAGLTLTQRTTGTSNAIQLARQHCIAAGEAQLERLSACGRPLEANQIEDLWPGVQTHLAVAEGQGAWKGLKLVTVQMKTQAQGLPVRVELSRYYDRSVEVQP